MLLSKRLLPNIDCLLEEWQRFVQLSLKTHAANSAVMSPRRRGVVQVSNLCLVDRGDVVVKFSLWPHLDGLHHKWLYLCLEPLLSILWLVLLFLVCSKIYLCCCKWKQLLDD